MNIKKKALGRGLSALLDDYDSDASKHQHQQQNVEENQIEQQSTIVGTITKISLDCIESNPFQPRTKFEEEALMELAKSIKEQGIIQPITLRKIGENNFQLISGERRFKASKIAGLTEIPAYIRDANDTEMLEMALVENIQRENLNALEISISFQRLIDECNLTQEELSEKVGKNRTTVTNYLRLLKLPAEIQIGIRDDKISMGHARAIINVSNPDIQLTIYNKIVEKGLSVREVEDIVRNLSDSPKNTDKTKNQSIEFSERFKYIEKNLSNKFGTKINLKRNTNGKGNIVISFNSDEELNKIIYLLEK